MNISNTEEKRSQIDRELTKGIVVGLKEWWNLKNFQLVERGNPIDGKRNGSWEFFDRNGNLYRTGTFRNGELVGNLQKVS